LDIYRSASAHPDVKKAFVSSGIRYDILVRGDEKEARENHYDEYIEELVTNRVSGRLKIAPEHTSDEVLKVMRKPSFKYFYDFKKKFDHYCKKANLKQQLIPYFISSHPGSKVEDMAQLACETKDAGFQLEQVQDFTPTPMTVATVIYYSGYHPYTLKKMPTARTQGQKKEQHRFFFWYKRENQGWIRGTLERLNRPDLLEKLLGSSDRPKQQAKRRQGAKKRRSR
jgi:uncharacterized radical SAM protein YgiQ